jgi:PKD repeat protein
MIRPHERPPLEAWTARRVLTAAVAVAALTSACTQAGERALMPSRMTLDDARSHADSDAAGYFRAASTRRLAPSGALRSVSASGSATVVSVTPGWFQGSAQRLPITAVLSGNVNSVTVTGGTGSGDAILCSGSYGTLVGYDANDVVLGSVPLSLIAPWDCGYDNVTFGAQATLTVTQGMIAKFTILPMSPVEFQVLGVRGGRASATYSVSLGEYPAVVDNPPKAVFSAACDYNTLTCTFDASGSTDDIGIASYAWDLNKSPGGTASGKVVTTTYPTAGPRTVVLTVTDTKGQPNTFSMTVQVGVAPGQPPYVAFSSSCTLTCTFNSSGSSGSSVLVRSWDFGDGSTAGDVVNPTHTYAAPGVYTVVLKATDAYGLSSYFASALVLGLPGGIGGMGMSSDCSAPGTCSFTSYAVGNNPPFTMSWRFGDGTTAGNVSNPTHTFPAAGTYAVTAIATDALGGKGAIALMVTVSAPPPPPTDAPPVASFTWTCIGQVNPHQCAFTSTSTDDFGIVSYKWDWGNGRSETKTIPTVRNTWASAGTYNVTLTVTDTKGQAKSVVVPVAVP